MKIFWVALIAAGCGRIFNDSFEEKNPGLMDTLNCIYHLQTLPAPLPKIQRLNLLESFGHFDCASCPEAESRLAPYIHPSLDTGGVYNPRLIVVHYHVRFASNTADEWITTGTQAVADAYGFSTALPQVKLNGSNGAYGFAENNVHYDNYPNLIAALASRDSLTPLEIIFDTAALRYDTLAGSLEFRFSVQNRGPSPVENLRFRVLAVKNLPVTFTLQNDPWEVIVVDAVEMDKCGNSLALSTLGGLTKHTWIAALNLGDETSKHQPRAGLGFPAGKIERVTGYALVVAAMRRDGGIENAFAYRYEPQRP